MLDKCEYHQPLSRQHHRMRDAGINVSRRWLTQLIQSTVALLESVYDAQLESIRASRIELMDETPNQGRPNSGRSDGFVVWCMRTMRN